MRIQNEVISVDNFRLQLSQLSQQEEQLRKETHPKQDSWIYTIQPLPISISRAASSIYFTLCGIFLFQTLDVYLTLYNKIKNEMSPFYLVQISGLTSSMSMLGYYLTPLLLAVITISLIFNKKQKKEGITLIFTSIGANSYPYLRYILQFTLIVSSYFAISGDLISILLFVLAALFAFLSMILLQNYTLRKDQFCCKSIEFYAVFRIVAIAAYTANIIAFNSVTKFAGVIGFVIFHLISSTVLLICYYSFGLTVYRNPVPRCMTSAIVFLYSTTSLSICYDVYLTVDQDYTHTTLQYIWPLITASMIYFFANTLSRIRRNSNSPKNDNITTKVYFFLNKYEGSYEDEQQDCEIRGILFEHKQHGCRNLQCVVNKQSVYDSKKKKYCSISKIATSKVSLIKFYVKCLFESYLAEKDDVDRMLDYLEFYYLKLKNVYFSIKLITQLEQKYLSFFQKLRLLRLKNYLISQSNGFSSDLFLKALSMQHVLRAEQSFSRIQKSIELVLKRNELFWKYIERNEVNLSDMLCTIQPNFRLIDAINADWTRIGNYFQINRRWKFYYICFTVYVKNEKLVPAMLEDFGNSVEYDSIFKTSNYFIDKTTDKELLYNSIMLFEQNTCFVHATCDDEKMNITKVSNYFSTNFGYDRNDIVNSPLQILMTPTVKKLHSQMFMKWVKDGRSNNEDFYSVKKVYPLTKKGYINPCFKFYKTYLRLQGEVQYIGMFKRNRQDELTLIANADFEIEGITEALGHKFNLEKGDYVYIRGINLLALLPALIKYTRFANRIEGKDDDFMDNDENKSYFRKQSYLSKQSNVSQAAFMDILHQRQTLNLVNMKLILPTDMRGALEHYNYSKDVDKLDTYQSICELHSKIKRSKNFTRFKLEINIREKQMMGQRYYEIEINEFEENNRLEKIRMAEQQSQRLISTSSIANIQENRLGNIDLELFFHVSKKKSKVVLFPSNNIFLKEENNRALREISHVSNITLSIKLSLFLFLSIALSELIVQLVMGPQIELISQQYYTISHHEKLTALLNTQYNVQIMNLGNNFVETFVIVEYTQQLILTLGRHDFLLLFYDISKNTPEMFKPYYSPLPVPGMQGIAFPPLDQFQLIFKMYESAISLHRSAEDSASVPLNTRDYYTINNYNHNYYSKVNKIKTVLSAQFQERYTMLSNMMVYLGIAQVILLLLCFLFILLRLLNLSRGFTELLSIFVQMDNLDIRKIFRFMQFLIGLFGHLNDKNQRMTVQTNSFTNSLSNVSEYDKQNSEGSFTEEQNMISVNANLNKKIKKIELGDQIKKMRTVALAMIIVYLLLVGVGILAINIYATVSLQNYRAFQELGYSTMRNGSLVNILHSGVYEKFRNASIYVPEKYEPYLRQFRERQSSNLDISVSSGSSNYQNLYKQIYYQNFCVQLQEILDITIAQQIKLVCSIHIQDLSRCAYLRQALLLEKLIETCTTLHNAQLTKGVSNYYKYIVDILTQFLNNQGNLTAQDIFALNWAQIIIGIYDEHLMEAWAAESTAMLDTRQTNIVIITASIFVFIIIIHFVFVEYLIAKNLNDSYQVFRKIHEHFIPEFVINKEKIIKAKLIREGFMKD